MITQETLVGTRAERIDWFLRHQMAGVAFRALIPKEVIEKAGPICHNRNNDYAEDTIWIFQLATVGNLQRIPKRLYKKRYHESNTHYAWHLGDLKQERQVWRDHCRELLDIAGDEHLDAIKERLMKGRSRFGVFLNEVEDSIETEQQELHIFLRNL